MVARSIRFVLGLSRAPTSRLIESRGHNKAPTSAARISQNNKFQRKRLIDFRSLVRQAAASEASLELTPVTKR